MLSLCRDPVQTNLDFYGQSFLSSFVLFLKTHMIGIAFLPGGKQQGSQVLFPYRKEISDGIVSIHLFDSGPDIVSWTEVGSVSWEITWTISPTTIQEVDSMTFAAVPKALETSPAIEFRIHIHDSPNISFRSTVQFKSVVQNVLQNCTLCTKALLECWVEKLFRIVTSQVLQPFGMFGSRVCRQILCTIWEHAICLSVSRDCRPLPQSTGDFRRDVISIRPLISMWSFHIRIQLSEQYGGMVIRQSFQADIQGREKQWARVTDPTSGVLGQSFGRHRSKVSESLMPYVQFSTVLGIFRKYRFRTLGLPLQQLGRCNN